MGYWLYIIQSASRDRYYIGHTNDLDRRLNEHNSRHTRSTRSGRPWKLVYSRPFESKTAAYAEERRLKQMKSREVIEELIEKG